MDSNASIWRQINQERGYGEQGNFACAEDGTEIEGNTGLPGPKQSHKASCGLKNSMRLKTQSQAIGHDPPAHYLLKIVLITPSCNIN